MTLDELQDACLAETGQYAMQDWVPGDPKLFERIVTKKSLPFFGRFRPLIRDNQILAPGPIYQFIMDGIHDIPDWISRVTPIEPYGYYRSLATSLQGRLPDTTKPTFLWRYDKPVLHLEYSGKAQCRCCYRPVVVDVSTTDPNTNVTTVVKTFKYLDESAIDALVGLTSGHLLVAIGRSRRNATLQDLPVTIAGQELIDEGNQMIEKYENSLKNELYAWEGWW